MFNKAIQYHIRPYRNIKDCTRPCKIIHDYKILKNTIKYHTYHKITYNTIKDCARPNKTIQDHTRPYKTRKAIKDLKRPYKS